MTRHDTTDANSRKGGHDGLAGSKGRIPYQISVPVQVVHQIPCVVPAHVDEREPLPLRPRRHWVCPQKRLQPVHVHVLESQLWIRAKRIADVANELVKMVAAREYRPGEFQLVGWMIVCNGLGRLERDWRHD
ncbi:hypothetical protein ABW21_db0201078 [Orbilia brochopaga]|nr:hypothetical protein ABW21_db0201078 [Drechslerella brochopaga]